MRQFLRVISNGDKKNILASVKGLTLIETLVAIGIFTMGIGGFSMLLVQEWKSNKYTIEMGRSSMVISQGVNKITDHLRSARQADNGAYPIQSADANDLVVFSDYDRDGVTERLHFYKSGQYIKMGIRNPSNTMPRTYASGDEEVADVANYIVNTSSDPIFAYYGKDYAGDASELPLVTPAVVANIRLVKIRLKINIDVNRAPDNIEMQTFVELRNLNDYDRLK